MERTSSERTSSKIFEEEYRQHYPRLVAYFNGSLRCYQDAEDFAQETLTHFWEHSQRYLFQSAGNRAAIISCIARNLLRDCFRHQKSAPRIFSLDDIPRYAEDDCSFVGLIEGINPMHLDRLIREEAAAMLRARFESNHFWQVCEQKLAFGASYREMALKSGISYSTFMDRVFRGRALALAWVKKQGFEVEVSSSGIC